MSSFKYNEETSQMVTINTILERKKHHDNVSLFAYVALGQRVGVPTRFEKVVLL